MMKKVILILMIGFTMFACNDDTSVDNRENVDYEVMQKGYLSGDHITSNPQSNAITNQDEWNQLVSLLTTEFYDLNTINIDFNTQYVLYIVDEPRSAGGYSIDVDAIFENANTIDVHINSSFSDASEIDMPTQPFCLVKISKTDKSINFIFN